MVSIIALLKATCWIARTQTGLIDRQLRGRARPDDTNRIGRAFEGGNMQRIDDAVRQRYRYGHPRTAAWAEGATLRGHCCSHVAACRPVQARDTGGIGYGNSTIRKLTLRVVATLIGIIGIQAGRAD